MSGQAPRVPFALLVLALVVGGLCLLLALNTASAANELERHDLASKDQQVAAQVQQLRNEVALRSAPGALAQAAAELGMVPAGNPAFIVVGKDGTVRVLGKPKAVAGIPVAAPVVKKPRTPSVTPSATTSPTAKSPTAKSPTAKSPTAKSPTAKSPTAKPPSTPSPHKPSKRTATPTPTPTPAPTPTPTLTLPGGNR